MFLGNEFPPDLLFMASPFFLWPLAFRSYSRKVEIKLDVSQFFLAFFSDTVLCGWSLAGFLKPSFPYAVIKVGGAKRECVLLMFKFQPAVRQLLFFHKAALLIKNPIRAFMMFHSLDVVSETKASTPILLIRRRFCCGSG